MTGSHHENIEMIKYVATRLESLREKMVFLGGATTGLLITDKAMPEIRSTLDVDTIVEIRSRTEYYDLEESLRDLGFIQSMDENDPICRWIIDEIKVDIMPTDEKILGFSNRWYLAAIENATEMEIDKNLKIRIVTAPYFLATKIEAFYGRGKDDYFGSHDLEDIITVIDGRKEIIEELEASFSELKAFLAAEVQNFLNNDTFMEALPGHLLPDEASQARIKIILQRLRRIAKIR